MVTWTMADALALIRDLQPLVWELDYHVMLGGGVLNKGESEKDLDLFFSPLTGYEPRFDKLFILLESVFGRLRAMRDSPDYGLGAGPQYWSGMLIASYEGKRVDIFILQ